MALVEFTEVPDFKYTWEDVPPPADVVNRDPVYGKDRVDLAPLLVELRRYSWSMEREDAEVPAIEAFFRARRWTGESFLVLDPKIPTRTDVSLGNATGGQTVFALPTPLLMNGENSRDYPRDDGPGFAGTSLTLNAVAQTITDVDTDARTVTIAAPATAGHAILVSYIPLRRVELVDRFGWTPMGFRMQTASPMLMEVRS